MKTAPLLLALALTLAAAPLAAAQSRNTSVLVAAANEPDLGLFYKFASIESDVGAPVSVSGGHSFTGLDRAGVRQTMTFAGSGFASSEYGRLHSSMNHSIMNLYSNPTNPAYTDGTNANEAGSPDQLSVDSYAGFTDRLQFGGEAGFGYTARYVFFLDGTISGDGVAAIFGNVAGEFFTLPPLSGAGTYARYLTTDSYPIDGNNQQEASFTLTTQFNPRLKFYTDGQDLASAADFSSTATLAEIQLFDPSGNQVDPSRFTVTSASGTVYNTQPVPEPASLAALGLGALALLKRRRKV